jgi:TetR/AcrR family transcriptional regulator, transcriptional repressor for nem operon
MKSRENTKSKVLKIGRSLLQQHGYNGFSFQDIAHILEIKKPSLYDHYASKEDLIIAILDNYEHLFQSWTQTVKDLSPIEQIKQVFKVFYHFCCDGKKVCPVLSLITDLTVLSSPTQKAMKNFITQWLAWLTEVIIQGQKLKKIRSDLKADELAQLIYSQIMGSQLQARIKNKPFLTLEAADLIIKLIQQKSN